jgi:hypothetical protein
MSYIFPSVVVNHITYTAQRWGQFPTITYIIEDIEHNTITAGHEIVTVADDLSNITIQIEDGVSTNDQIIAAIIGSDITVESLFPRDLIIVVVEVGHEADTNTAVSAQSMTGAVNVPPPVEPAIPSIEILVTDPVNPTEGQVWYNLTDHAMRFFDGTDVQTVLV